MRGEPDAITDCCADGCAIIHSICSTVVTSNSVAVPIAICVAIARAFSVTERVTDGCTIIDTIYGTFVCAHAESERCADRGPDL